MRHAHAELASTELNRGKRTSQIYAKPVDSIDTPTGPGWCRSRPMSPAALNAAPHCSCIASI